MRRRGTTTRFSLTESKKLFLETRTLSTPAKTTVAVMKRNRKVSAGPKK